MALKRPHVMAGQADRLRSRQEAEIAAQVHHPNAISVFDTVDGDECWLVMEYSPAMDRLAKAFGFVEKERWMDSGMLSHGEMDAGGILHWLRPGALRICDRFRDPSWGGRTH